MSDKKQQPAYPLRMPSELRADLEALAQNNKRSLNAEIVARLEHSISDTDELGVSDKMRLDGVGDWYSFERKPRGINKEQLTKAVDGVPADSAPGPSNDLIELFANAILLASERLASQPVARKKARGKQTRPLGMDAAEWEAIRAKQNSPED